MITQFIVSSAVRSLQLLRLSKYSKYLGAMAALLALRFIWLIGHDALWNPPPGCFHGACAHTPRRVRREVALTAGADQRNCSVLMRVRPTSPSAFCLADSSCSGLVSISAAFSMSTGLFTRFCMRARPGADSLDSSCAARETRHQSGRPAWAGALRGRGQVAGVRLPKTMACIWSGQERTGQAGKGRRHGTSVLPTQFGSQRYSDLC